MTVTSIGSEPAILVRDDRAYVGCPEFFDPERLIGDEFFDVTETTARRLATQRFELASAIWEMDAGGRLQALMLIARSSMTDLIAMGDAPVRVNHGARADLVSLAPSPGGTEIVVRVKPWELPAMWPLGLRIHALGVIRAASVPAGLLLPRIDYRRGLRRFTSTGAIDPLGRLVVLTRRR
ncbi:hypothetical protein ACFQLX_10245 [Streptomyces polyrhachis]|uniref:Uncharacterized protein n=1 Tax=Streptomyces polyrhachis TaxID=1282885 RepID=A0ABW2GCN6_9ACTN